MTRLFRRRLVSGAWLAAVCALCAWLAACSSDLGDKRAGEACTRSSQCAGELVCSRGVCRTPAGDAGKVDIDAGDDDAGE